jgi:hypothetical protein
MSNISEPKNDEKTPIWDMSQERAFMGNLLGQRFNFFLVFFSLVIAGALNTKSMLHLQIVLGIGSTICWLILPTLLRAQQKLDLSLEELFKNPTHPATVLNSLANTQDDKSKLKRCYRTEFGTADAG